MASNTPPWTKIVTPDFLKNCAVYEFLKNKNDPKQGHKHLNEAMISEIIRSEVTNELFEIRNFATKDSEPEDVPSENIEPMEHDDLEKEVVNALKRNPDTEESSASGNSKRHKALDESGTEDLEKSLEESMNLENASQLKAPIHYLLKQNEKDVGMNAFRPNIVKSMFDTFRRRSEDGKTIEDLEFEWPCIPICLSEMRNNLYSYFGTTYATELANRKEETCPYNKMSVIIDFGKIKIHFDHQTDSEKNLDLEYWDDEEGCLIWHDNSPKLVKEVRYEVLAGMEVINALLYLNGMHVTLDNLSFDFADKTSWDPKRRHAPIFITLIRSWFNGECFIKTKEFFMKMYRYGMKKEVNPFELEFLMPNILETITIRGWDDSDITPEFLHSINNSALQHWETTEQWKNATTLDMACPYLYEVRPHYINHFENIRMWKMTEEIISSLIGKFTYMLPTEECIITVTNDNSFAEFYDMFQINFKEKNYTFGHPEERLTMSVTKKTVIFFIDHTPIVRKPSWTQDLAPFYVF